MEKRISFFHFQSVKSVAKAIDPHVKSLNTLKGKVIALKEEHEAKVKKLEADFKAKAEKLKEEYDMCQVQIDSLEAGVFQTTGFHVYELVKKIVEPTGKTDPKTNKPIKVTKYVPTDIVTYDEKTKEFVVKTNDETQEEQVNEETELPVEEEIEEVVEETEEPVEDDLPWN